jgi:hypothetical protein
MRNFTTLARLAFIPLIALSSCADTGTATATASASGPVAIQQARLAATWQVQEESDGIRYTNPKSSLVMFFIRKVAAPAAPMTNPPLIEQMYSGETPQPPPGVPQIWKYTQILGQTVRWYQQDMGSGADFPGFATEPFAITNAQGKREYYKIIVTHGMGSGYVNEIDSWLRGVSMR